MSYVLNETHDPVLTSWVPSANEPGTDFPIQNLPFGIFRPAGSNSSARIGVAIGNQVLDLAGCAKERLLDPVSAEACSQRTLNALMVLGPERWSGLRLQLSRMLRSDAERRPPETLLYPMAQCEMLLPARIGDYTDFYSSIHHATNVGAMFRPDNPLLPNYKWVPVGYHGRASSVVISGTDIRRPQGQTMRDGAERPQFGPTLRLDYELEIGAFIGPGNPLGAPISIERAEDHLFGLCIVNDWSARDIQKWEYQPLGPFLAKSFVTSVSPWVVTLEALLPFRVPASSRDVEPLEYLRQEGAGAFDVQVAAYLRSESMRAKGLAPVQVSSGNLRDLYWTFAQMATHHSSNGCNLRTGDLIASGTVSGAVPGSQGCLLELTRGGKQAIELPSGEERRFLEDGDEVFLRAWCERDGAGRVGFGACSGMVLATDERRSTVIKN